MLKLSRYINQKFILELPTGEQIVITNCSGYRIDLGFEAPQSVRIYRAEKYIEEKEKERERAKI